MDTNRKTAVVAGILFITATLAGVISVAITTPILDKPDCLLKISANENRLLAGAFFELIMAFACAGIAISMYPVLKKYNEGLALGAVGFRLMEGVLDIVVTICLLLFITLSKEFAKAGITDLSYFQTSGRLLLALRDWVGNVVMLLSWCIGALMYYLIFYQTRLVPQWLSVWGIIGITLTIASCMLVMFGFITPMSSTQIVLNFPIGLQEMVLAVWLIVKGFDPSVINDLSSNQV